MEAEVDGEVAAVAIPPAVAAPITNAEITLRLIALRFFMGNIVPENAGFFLLEILADFGN